MSMYRDSRREGFKADQAPGCKYYRTSVPVRYERYGYGIGMDTLLLVDYDITVQYYLYR
jgi:hypothetical protein